MHRSGVEIPRNIVRRPQLPLLPPHLHDRRGAARQRGAAPPAAARAPSPTAQGSGPDPYNLGSYQLTALYDGVWYCRSDEKFVRNASRADVNDALAAGFLLPNILLIAFTPLLVNTGEKPALIDTGTAGQMADTAGSLLDNFKAAGIEPTAIDTILISHSIPTISTASRPKSAPGFFRTPKSWCRSRNATLDGRCEQLKAECTVEALFS